MEIEIGNLRSKLITDNPKLLEALHDKYGFLVPGYNYTPQYKRRVWDGRKHYFAKNGIFRTGLLSRVVNDLLSIGAENVGLNRTYKLPDPIQIQKVKKFNYYDYQKEAIQHVLNFNRGVIESPVGSGKTLIMAGIVASLAPRKMVILFKEKGILKQTYDFFKTCGIESLGINSGEGFIYGDIMLSTVQSIEKILDTHLEQAEVLMIDEAHQFCKGDTTIAAIEAFPNAIFRIAFTATVPSEKNDIHGRLTLEGAFGAVYSTRSTEDLIKDGKLAKPNIQILEFKPTLSLEDEDLGYQQIYEKFIVNNEQRNQMIANIYQLIKKSPNSKTLILVKNLEHLHKLKALIPHAYTVEGKDNIEERYDIIQAFIKDNNHPIIIGTNVMQTGININEISHMINARGLEGEIPTIQGLGRGIRKAENKTEMHFYDFYDTVPYLEKHSKSRIKHYENHKFQISYVKLN
jgi:superfamily II DNA or RNA helicase